MLTTANSTAAAARREPRLEKEQIIVDLSGEKTGTQGATGSEGGSASFRKFNPQQVLPGSERAGLIINTEADFENVQPQQTVPAKEKRA
jgi:hypothetical protein